MDTRSLSSKKKPGGFTGLQVFGFVAAGVVAAIVATVFVFRFFFFPAPFKPVELNDRERRDLGVKLEKIESVSGIALEDMFGPVSPDELTSQGVLKPEAYSEAEASRRVALTEREFNALIANNTDLARRFAIDFAPDLISAKLLVPVDPDFPILGGKTIRVRAGLELALRQGRPVVKLRGVSLMGIALPNAWLGGIKNVDLIEQYGGGPGFWKGFADGIDTVMVTDGRLVILFNE